MGRIRLRHCWGTEGRCRSYGAMAEQSIWTRRYYCRKKLRSADEVEEQSEKGC